MSNFGSEGVLGREFDGVFALRTVVSHEFITLASFNLLSALCRRAGGGGDDSGGDGDHEDSPLISGCSTNGRY